MHAAQYSKWLIETWDPILTETLISNKLSTKGCPEIL